MVPPPLTPARAVTSWTPDVPVLVVVLAAALLYLAGMRRIRRSGRPWPRAWAVAFLIGGTGTVVIATMSFLGVYQHVLFTFYNVRGCAGLVNTGNPVTISATYTVTPTQTMTSP
ncbi:MAG: cytochrome c oxidase assembly protein [Actinobacteria bacterium]|nr:cytochrome c oxidase assembly protein [Actinomycetota bacterium]